MCFIGTRSEGWAWIAQRNDCLGRVLSNVTGVQKEARLRPPIESGANPTKSFPMRPQPILTATILLALVGSVHAADKSPHQILGGKPAAISSGPGSYYDGSGSFAGRSSASGRSTSLYDSRGGFAGRVEIGKDSTKFYDAKGGFAGRTQTSGNSTSFYDSKGAFSGRSTTSGSTTKFYDSKGAYSGRSETSDGTTKFYDAAGRLVGSRKK